MKFREFCKILKKSFRNAVKRLKKDKRIHTMLGIYYNIKKDK